MVPALSRLFRRLRPAVASCAPRAPPMLLAAVVAAAFPPESFGTSVVSLDRKAHPLPTPLSRAPPGASCVH